MTLIKGDGIGPEIAMSVVQIADAAKVYFRSLDVYPACDRGLNIYVPNPKKGSNCLGVC